MPTKPSMPPNVREALSTFIGIAKVTPVKEIAKRFKITETAAKEAKHVADEAGHRGLNINNAEKIESLLQKEGVSGIKKTLNFLGILGLEGGKRKPSKRRTIKKKKLTIPPEVAEEAIEVLAEVAVGGKRRKTRKQK